MTQQQEGKIGIVTAGHVDAGKSTICGVFLSGIGMITEREKNQFFEEAVSRRRDSFGFAYMMDSTKEERERGITMELSHRQFEIDGKRYSLIDAPGHRDFVKTMVTGVGQARAGILVIAAGNIMAQTKEHALILRTMGINQLIIAVNKMDIPGFEFGEQAFNNFVDQINREVLIPYRIPISRVSIIPVSAYNPQTGQYGHNVVTRSEAMPWYTGPTILDVVKTFSNRNFSEEVNKPFRMAVANSYQIKGVGTVLTGYIEQGVLRKGDQVSFIPSGEMGVVRTIEMYRESFPEARPGDDIGVNITGVDHSKFRKGEVMTLRGQEIPSVLRFTADLILSDEPHVPEVINIGYTPIVHFHVGKSACRIVSIQSILGVSEANPSTISRGATARVTFEAIRPIAIEPSPSRFSRFIVRDMGETIGVGVCQGVVIE